MAKRLAAIGLESTEPRRRAYREMLFSTDGLGEYIGGVILFDETVRQQAQDGCAFPPSPVAPRHAPGIKVDRGTQPLAGFPGEVATQGPTGCGERFEEYAVPTRFAKGERSSASARGCRRTPAWRPTPTSSRATRHCPEGGLTPIVEPEVLMDRSHDLRTCAEVTERVLREVYAELQAAGGAEASSLKPNMVLPGSESTSRRATSRSRTRPSKCFAGRCLQRAGHPVPVRRTDR